LSFTYKAYEVDIRRTSSDAPPITINDTDELVEGLREYYDGLDREVVLAVILDDINRILGFYEVSKGGISEAEIEFSNVLRPVILMGGRKVILVHNHPNGEPEASEGDLRMAKGLFLACSLVDIELADNIVLGASSYRSINLHEEFERWLTEDLQQIAAVMSHGVMAKGVERGQEAG
jgi:DNA repair protein RadC